jgi:hypothetical protein
LELVREEWLIIPKEEWKKESCLHPHPYESSDTPLEVIGPRWIDSLPHAYEYLPKIFLVYDLRLLPKFFGVKFILGFMVKEVKKFLG